MNDPAASALWLLLLRLVFPAPLPAVAGLHCILPSPRNVHFISRNMKNVLHWLPPEGIAVNKLIYNVKYLIYGTYQWIKYPECKNISQTWCDLSHGTYDHREQYHARVKVFLNGNCSAWAESSRFNPLTDTTIDPPEFSLSSTENSVSVTMVPPEKWKRNPREEPQYLHEIYPGLQYNVSVFNKNINKRWMFSIKKSKLELHHLQPNTVYCVTVQIYITPLLFSRLSEDHCIATLKDPVFKQTATVIFGYILPGLLIALILLVSSCGVYRYTHLVKQKYPTNLILKYSKSCVGDHSIPSEKIVANFITENVAEQHKSFLKNAHLTDSGYIHVEIGEGNPVEEKVFQKGLGNQNILEKEIVPENEQSRNKTKMVALGVPQASDQIHSDEVVVYEFDVRAEQTIPVQEKEEKYILNDNICVSKDTLYNSELPTYKTEQDYCPQFDTQYPDTSLGQQLKKLILNGREPSSEQLYDAHIPLINLVTDKPDHAFCPECDVLAVSYLVPDPKQPFLDEKGAPVKELQTLKSLIAQHPTSRSHQAGTRACQGQEAETEEEQSLRVNWNSWKGRVYLPALSDLTKEDRIEKKKYEESLEDALLFRFYESQCSEDLLGGFENIYLLQLKEHWGLHIKMQS